MTVCSSDMLTSLSPTSHSSQRRRSCQPLENLAEPVRADLTHQRLTLIERVASGPVGVPDGRLYGTTTSLPSRDF